MTASSKPRPKPPRDRANDVLRSEGHPLDASVSAALRELEEHVAELAHLGCYPAGERP